MGDRERSFGMKKVFEGFCEVIDNKINKMIDTKNISETRMLTFEDVVQYYFSMKKQIPEINKCVLYMERIGGAFKFRIEQLFKNSSDEILFADEAQNDVYGRIILAEALDEDLRKLIVGKDSVMVLLKY